MTKLIGTASIYAITPVSEEIARGLNIKRPNAPVQAYELPSDAKQDASLQATSKWIQVIFETVGPDEIY